MKTTALRLYGKNDVRLESFELPENMLKATAVFKVEIDSLTGKQSGF